MSETFLTTPLGCFHTKFVSIFDELPQNERASEATRRVIIAVASLFAYPILGCLYLAGRFYDSFLKNERSVKLVNIFEKMEEMKSSFLDKMNELTKMKPIEIQSAKILFTLKVDQHHLISKDFFILKDDKSPFDEKFLTQAFESRIKELGELIQKETAEKVEFKWAAFIKETNQTFAGAHGSVSETPLLEGAWNGNWRVSADDAEKLFKSRLKNLGREIKPQLNDQLEFI